MALLIKQQNIYIILQDPDILLLSSNPTVKYALVDKKKHEARMLIAALFITAPNWKQHSMSINKKKWIDTF